MNACNEEFDPRILDGELSPAEESAVLAHLDNCEQCQRRLELAAGEAGEWSATRELLSSSAERISWPAAGVEMIDQTRPFVHAEGDDAVGRPPLIDLSFLSPADDPAYAGRVGPYEIAGVIGQGGMGVVLKAVDRSLSRHVAIKVLSPLLANAGAARQRFAREARAMAALSHEHVVPIYAVDEHRGLPYFAMEYVPGGTLAARLAQQGPLETVAAVRIAMQTALALSAAHDSGLVHRDIKPANILLDRGIERVRVADFGLARTASEASDTASGMLAGTPQFMSPEQINRDECDARSDLFSLGGVMYAMCTGHAPFRAESVFAVLQRIVHDEPRPIREKNPSVPSWLEAFVGKLMAKDREARFASAAEVAELLEQELAHLQNPGSGAAPARAWLPRQRTFGGSRGRRFAATALLGALTAAVVAWGPWRGVEPGSDQDIAPAIADEAPALEPPTVPLWNADGMVQAQHYAEALEFGEASVEPPGFDPWSADMTAAQQRVIRLIEETQVPNSPRSEP